MRRFPARIGSACIAALALVACGRPGPVAENTESAAALPDVDRQPPDAMTGAGDVEPSNAAAPGAADKGTAEIPTALRGRWALSPGDCVLSTPSPGVLIVTADGLRFHESVARPLAKSQTSADTISGDFAFSGEGESWVRFQTLQLQDKRLVRTERDPMRSYAYVRCSG